MALILQVVAAVLTVLGAATLYWGTSPSLLSLGNFVMVVGAVIAGLLFGGSINQGVTIETFLYSLLGAVILLAIVNLIRRGSVR